MARRIRIDATLDPELHAWLQSKIDDHTFMNVSHALEYCLFSVKSKWEEDKR